MAGIIPIVYVFIFLLIPEQKERIELYLIGDSTVSEYPADYYPRMGWGQALSTFFQNDVQVHNKAISGRSTKSFIAEGHWQKVLDAIDEGDYLLIQFGHNDMKTEQEHLYAAPFGAYTENLTIFIEEARRKKAHPVLVTPVYRRRFDTNGFLKNSLGDYPVAVRMLAERMQVPLIDLHQQSFKLFTELGPEKTKDIFLWLSPGEYENYPKGIEDNSHFSEKGAFALSGLVVNEIKRLDLPVVSHLKESPEN
jgi:lysophospholipase L1-like esterase